MTIETELQESNLDRLPPQSLDSEQAVIGGLLVSGEAITRVIDLLEPEHFYRKAHAVIYAAMLDLFDKNEPIDIVTVSQYLKDEGKLENVGGRQYITDLSLSVATTANLEYYARIVQEKALLRSLIKAGTEIVSTSYEEPDADAAIDRAEHLIFNLAQRRSMQQLIHIKNIVEASFQRIEQRYENRDSLSGVPSGFYDLDALTSGFQASDLIIVAARPSMGKCLAFDSELVMSDGSLATIENIYKNKQANLLTLNDDLKLAWTQPSAFVDDGIKPVFKVTTRLGRTVETTISHPFLTISGWKKLEQIAVGTKIAVPRALPVFGLDRMRECKVKLIAYLLGDGCLSNRKASFTNTNALIQNDFVTSVSEFGGVNCRVENNGHRATSFAIRGDADFISRNRKEFGQRLRAAVRSKFGSAQKLAMASGLSRTAICLWQQGHCVPSQIRFDKLCESLDVKGEVISPFARAAISRSSQNPLVLWLKELDLWGKTAHQKTIPSPIFKLERSQLALFLNRLFATDGWATVLTSGQPQLGFASVSEKLIRQIQHLLLRFGIISKIRERQVKYRGGRNQAFQLDITDSNSIRVFAEEIGIYGKELAIKRVKQAVSERRRQTNCDLIPMEIWREITLKKQNESWASLARRSNFIDCTNIHANRRQPSRGRLRSIAGSLNDISLWNLANSDVYWDEVVSIEPRGLKQVYDLTVPDTHNFVANDICVHNTALCLTVAQHIAIEQKIPVAIFSLEMSKEQLVQRMLCSEASIDANRLRTGHLHTNDWTHLAMAMGRLGEAPIFIDDSALLNVLEIRAKARRLKAEMKGLGLIIVDYIQLLQGRKQTDNRVQEVSEISRSLKTLAREINVPVIALSQLSRAVEARQNKRPMLSDLRESGSIEQDADIVMFIYRDDYYNPESERRGEAEIIIAKQRNGPTGTVDLLYQSSITRFLNKVHNQYNSV
jgi:replicative DNA helicase